MIVFIAPFPALADEKDGMVQRVASIDALVSDLPRTYLDISVRRFWRRQVHQYGQATVFQINAIRDFFFIWAQLRKARLVYVHSVFYAMKALPAYWIGAPVTDLHGAVPEEFRYQGKPALSVIFGLVERIVLRRSAAVVHVTDAMKQHFQRKYGRNGARDCTVAIIPKMADPRGERQHVMGAPRDPKGVVYAGGTQAWQNVPLMLEAAACAPQLHFVLLSGHADVLRRMADAARIAHCACAAVAPDQVPDYYLRASFGFLLRDPVLLNQVACPTKLVEYLHWGVIPVVLSEQVGDFAALGYRYVTLADFRAGRLPDQAMMGAMREANRDVVERLMRSCDQEFAQLKSRLRD
jgi:hypothetical protein